MINLEYYLIHALDLAAAATGAAAVRG